MLFGQRRVRAVGLALMLLVAVVLASFAAWGVVRPAVSSVPVVVGTIANFPLNSVTSLQLPTFFNDPRLGRIPQVMLQELPWQQRLAQEIDDRWPGWVPASLKRTTSIPTYLVNDPQQGLILLYRRDTQSSCAVYWQEREAHFADPCHGAWYTYTGEYVRGPATRGLDHFGVTVNERGEVLVDVRQFTEGKQAP